MTLSQQDWEAIDERIAANLEGDSIAAIFQGASEKDREDIAHAIGRFLYERQYALRSPENTFTPRWLWAGADINHSSTTLTVANEVGHKGPTLPRIINLESGFDADLESRSEAQQLNIRARGGGADCMFDYIVSPCWADEVSAGRGTEGQTMTSLTGCTFIVYSTIAAAATAMSALGVASHPVLFICPGTYTENAAFTGPSSSTVTIIGAGRNAVFWTGATSAGATLEHTTGASTSFRMRDLRIIAHSSAGAMAILDDAGSSDWQIQNCDISSGGNSSGIAVVNGPSGTGLGMRISDSLILGSGYGFNDEAGGSTSTAWGNVRLVNCIVSSAVGALFTNDNNFEAVRTRFSGARGIQNSASFTCANLYITQCEFECSTAAIDCTSGGSFTNSHIIGTRFRNCPIGITLGTTDNGANYVRIIGNDFETTTGTHVAITDNGALRHSVILGNTFEGYDAGNEIIGVDTTDNTVGHNRTDSGATLTDTHATELGFTGSGGDPTRIIDADGDTKVDVEESADEDIIRFDTAGTQRGVINADGNWVVGGDETQDALAIAGGSSDAKLAVRIDGVSQPGGLIFTQHSSTLPTSIGPALLLAKSRGSLASQSAVSNNDLLGNIRWLGHDGTDYEYSSGIFAEVDGTVGAGDIPGRLEFHTAPSAGTLTERLRINNAGVLVSTSSRERWPVTAKTIATDQVAVASGDTGHWTLAGEGGVADDLDGITGGTQGDILLVSAVSDSVTITIKHNNAGGSTGAKIFCVGNADITLDDFHDIVLLVYKTALDSGNGGWMAGLVGGGAGGGVTDAADLTYTPAQTSDWDSSADPGDTNDALDQLAERVKDMETARVEIRAGEMRPALTSGCDGPIQHELATNDVDVVFMDFDGTSTEYAIFEKGLPGWDLGTVTFHVHWATSSSTATDSVSLWLQGRAYGDSETLDQAYGTAIEVNDDATATAYQHLKTAESAAVTVGGTPASPDELIQWRLQRVPSDAGDDMSADCRVLKVCITYTRNAPD